MRSNPITSFGFLATFFVAFAILLAPVASFADSDFPGRDQYSRFGVEFLELDELYENFDDYKVIDVRSSLEYRTAHITGAVHVDLESRDFRSMLREANERDPRPVAFYCNGRSCYKSYDAVVESRRAGIEDARAFDAGLEAWIVSHPRTVTILGEDGAALSRSEALSRFIRRQEFESRLIPPMEFAAQVHSGSDLLVLDIRDEGQRGAVPLFPWRQENHSLKNIEAIVSDARRAAADGRRILIYDESGRQVRWLQYWLDAAGLVNYGFMEGGVSQFNRDVLGGL